MNDTQNERGGGSGRLPPEKPVTVADYVRWHVVAQQQALHADLNALRRYEQSNLRAPGAPPDDSEGIGSIDFDNGKVVRLLVRVSFPDPPVAIHPGDRFEVRPHVVNHGSQDLQGNDVRYGWYLVAPRPGRAVAADYGPNPLDLQTFGPVGPGGSFDQSVVVNTAGCSYEIGYALRPGTYRLVVPHLAEEPPLSRTRTDPDGTVSTSVTIR